MRVNLAAFLAERGLAASLAKTGAAVSVAGTLESGTLMSLVSSSQITLESNTAESKHREDQLEKASGLGSAVVPSQWWWWHEPEIGANQVTS